MDLFQKPGMVEHKPTTAQACGGRKAVVRVLLLALLITALHFVFVVRNESSCDKSGNCAFNFRGAGVVTLKSLPPLSSSYRSNALKPRYNFKSYEEYIQLQLNKTLNPKLRKLWTSRDWRRKVDVFSSIFQELMQKNLLKPGSKSLCVGARVGQEVLALKEIGVQDAVGMDLVPYPPLVVQGDMHRQPFENNTFDFEFSNVFDHALLPALFASEVERTLKPGGSAVIHVSLKRRGDKYSANDLFSVEALIGLFQNSEVVHIREVDAFGLDTEIVFKKRYSPEFGAFGGTDGVKKSHSSKALISQGLSANCPVSQLQQKIIGNAEPLITAEPQKPRITSEQDLKQIKYLPSLTDISSRRRYVYIDVGAGNYASSIGSWFRKEYPKQSQSFFVYAIEADKSFASDYMKRKDVELLPYAAWIRNESFLLRTSLDQPSGESNKVSSHVQRRSDFQKERNSKASKATLSLENRFKKVRAFDFAEWLKQTVSAEDFVVMKMDVGGTEFDLLPKMFETGAICLVDELFLDCHHNSSNDTIFGECLSLFEALRSNGVLAHQWW